MIGRPVFVFFKSAGLLLGGDDPAAAAAARLQPHGKLLLVILFFIIPVPHPNASQQVSLRFLSKQLFLKDPARCWLIL
jgi:hypothetical protein